jgi:XTP/dITP diphosphohydrolase
MAGIISISFSPSSTSDSHYSIKSPPSPIGIFFIRLVWHCSDVLYLIIKNLIFRFHLLPAIIIGMEKLLIATNNAGKIREFQALLQSLHCLLVKPSDIGLKLEVAENGDTYEANARLKAEAFCRASGLLTLADDSGLEVDALCGEPGIRSSRYAGPGAQDHNKVDYLLSRLKDVPSERRTARFRCMIAIAVPDGRLLLCQDTCEGCITSEPRGQAGFGYDPVFLFPDLGLTMAELPEETKNQLSHRGRAARAAILLLNTLLSG